MSSEDVNIFTPVAHDTYNVHYWRLTRNESLERYWGVLANVTTITYSNFVYNVLK